MQDLLVDVHRDRSGGGRGVAALVVVGDDLAIVVLSWWIAYRSNWFD